MIRMNSQGEVGGINPAIKRHYELQIKTLQNAPRDEGKLKALLKVKERQNEEAMHIEDTQRLVTEEIEMLKVVLRLVRRDTHTYARMHTSIQLTYIHAHIETANKKLSGWMDYGLGPIHSAYALKFALTGFSFSAETRHVFPSSG
jgi:hypothetical protein